MDFERGCYLWTMEDKAIISVLHLWKQLKLSCWIPLCKTGRVAKCHSHLFIQYRCSVIYLAMFSRIFTLFFCSNLCCNTSCWINLNGLTADDVKLNID